jgi:multimeric flavodoxin WrbA
MQTLIILGSARKDSHTRTLLKTVFADTPHDLVDLLDYNIATFDYDAKYPDSDQFGEIVHKMLNADTIIFATPVYWYAMSGMMKIFFDRFTDLVSGEKHPGSQFAGTLTFLFSVGAAREPPMGFAVPSRDTSS